MLKAAIFDMDGLLVDTEWLWQEAEMRIFAELGVPLTKDMCLETMGLRIDEVVAHWHARFPWEGPAQTDVAEAVVDEVARLIVAKAVLRPGVAEALALFRGMNLKLAVASSSAKRLIHTVLEHFGLARDFLLYRSAEDEEFGKPHPAVFIRTARDLGVAPVDCVALEDSFNGLLSCKSARMNTIVVPDPEQFDDPRWVIADLKLRSLADLRAEDVERLMGR